jgi:hypothetical protein
VRVVVGGCVANSLKENFLSFILQFFVPFFNVVYGVHEILHLLVVFVCDVRWGGENIADSLEKDSKGGKGKEGREEREGELVFSLNGEISFSFFLKFSWILGKFIIEERFRSFIVQS